MSSDLTLSQQASIIGCYKAPPRMWKPRRVTVNALVRKGYAIELRSGAIELTAKGIAFAKDGIR